MFYVGTVWHGGGANHTDERRLGVILEYAAAWLRAQENHVTAVPVEVVRTLEPRLQELLGYNIFPPFLGYVDGRHPRRALAERRRADGMVSVEARRAELARRRVASRPRARRHRSTSA